jgi:hypothetical protein
MQKATPTYRLARRLIAEFWTVTRDRPSEFLMFGTPVLSKPWKTAILYGIIQLIAIGLVAVGIVSAFAAWAICCGPTAP